MDIVLKPFNTVNRRFLEGAQISPADDIAPFDYADMKSRGFIGSSAPPLSSPKRQNDDNPKF